MTTFLVFLAVLAAGAVALLATGLPMRRPAAGPDGHAGVTGTGTGTGAGTPAAGGDPGLAEPDPRLPPVLLPDHVQPSDIGRLRFSVALRGYRMDQVDAVLARLATALAERDAALAAALAAAHAPGGDRPGEPGAPS